MSNDQAQNEPRLTSWGRHPESDKLLHFDVTGFGERVCVFRTANGWQAGTYRTIEEIAAQHADAPVATCPRCERPFATVEDIRGLTLRGKCPTLYAPFCPDAAKDCEKWEVIAKAFPLSSVASDAPAPASPPASEPECTTDGVPYRIIDWLISVATEIQDDIRQGIQEACKKHQNGRHEELVNRWASNSVSDRWSHGTHWIERIIERRLPEIYDWRHPAAARENAQATRLATLEAELAKVREERITLARAYDPNCDEYVYENELAKMQASRQVIEAVQELAEAQGRDPEGCLIAPIDDAIGLESQLTALRSAIRQKAAEWRATADDEALFPRMVCFQEEVAAALRKRADELEALAKEGK